MRTKDSEEFNIAKKGLEDLLKGYSEEYLYDIYSLQGFQGLSYVLKMAPKNIYHEVWAYIKQNKSALRFYMNFPDDV